MATVTSYHEEPIPTCVGSNSRTPLLTTCYLRLILHKVASRSFLELRTVTTRQGVVVEHPTLHDVAINRARGLISGQEEYFICMEEATTFRMPHQLRGLYVTLIRDGGPAPKTMGRIFKDILINLAFRLRRDTAVDETLRIIDLKLLKHGKNDGRVNLSAGRHGRTEYERMLLINAFKPHEQKS